MVDIIAYFGAKKEQTAATPLQMGYKLISYSFKKEGLKAGRGLQHG
jgi:hypothetical protein